MRETNKLNQDLELMNKESIDLDSVPDALNGVTTSIIILNGSEDVDNAINDYELTLAHRLAFEDYTSELYNGKDLSFKSITANFNKPKDMNNRFFKKFYQIKQRRKDKEKVKFLKDVLDDLKIEYVEKDNAIKKAEIEGDYKTARQIYTQDLPLLEQRKDVIVYEILSRQKKLNNG